MVFGCGRRWRAPKGTLTLWWWPSVGRLRRDWPLIDLVA
jgi:hypothetical protein